MRRAAVGRDRDRHRLARQQDDALGFASALSTKALPVWRWQSRQWQQCTNIGALPLPGVPNRGVERIWRGGEPAVRARWYTRPAGGGDTRRAYLCPLEAAVGKPARGCSRLRGLLRCAQAVAGGESARALRGPWTETIGHRQVDVIRVLLIVAAAGAVPRVGGRWLITTRERGSPCVATKCVAKAHRKARPVRGGVVPSCCRRSRPPR
jgi:hypothetical protein